MLNASSHFEQPAGNRCACAARLKALPSLERSFGFVAGPNRTLDVLPSLNEGD